MADNTSGKDTWDTFEGFNNDEKKSNGKFKPDTLLSDYKVPIFMFLVGLIIAGVGVLLYKDEYFSQNEEIQVLSTDTDRTEDDPENNKTIVVEVAGAVVNPGVYNLTQWSRINDALKQAGGLTENADIEWVDKVVNKAAKLVDGQKIYIPIKSEQSSDTSAKTNSGDQTISSGNYAENIKLININTASTGQLESLNGIGPVYAQKIVEYRPYSSVDELASKKVIPQNTYNKIKDKVSVY